MARLKLYNVCGDGRVDLAVVTTSKVAAVALFNEASRAYISLGTLNEYGRVRERDSQATDDHQVWAEEPGTVMARGLSGGRQWERASLRVVPIRSPKNHSSK
jgi:hypothetical protein